MKRTLFTTTLMLLFVSCINLFAQDEILTGNLTYKNAEQTPISGAKVLLTDAFGIKVDSVLTDTSGLYTFNGLYSGDYQLVFSSDIEPGGITVADAVMTLLHYLEVEPMTDPLQIAAADVNGDAVINHSDVLLIIRRYIERIHLFTPTEWVFDNPYITVGPDKNTTNTNGSGTSTGDLNGSYSPPISRAPIRYPVNEAGTTNISKSDQDIVLPVMFTSSMKEGFDAAGLGLVLIYSPELTEITDITSNLPGAEFNIIDNEIRIAWINPDLMGGKSDFSAPPQFNISMRPTANFYSGKGNISFTVDQAMTEVVGMKGEVLSGYGIEVPKATFQATPQNDVVVYPNPSRGETHLRFGMNGAGNVTLTITDITGRTVSLTEKYFETEGNYEMLAGQGLESGNYFYRLDTGVSVFTGMFSIE